MILKNYILEQPELFKAALANKEEILSNVPAMLSESMPDYIYIIASGTSKNAALAASVFMEDVLKREVRVVASSKSIEFKGDNPLVLYISQGGKSTNTIAAIERNRSQKAITIAITGNPEGIVNDMCQFYLRMPCGIENAGPKTKGYTMTILLLYMLAIETGRRVGTISESDAANYYDILEKTSNDMADNIGASFSWCEENKKLLSTIRCAYAAGKGQGEFIAAEGALKVMETFLIPSMGYEFEEYMHGPTCSLSSDIAGFYLLPEEDDVDYERVFKLAEYHREKCMAVFVIGGKTMIDKRDLALKTTGHWYTSPFEQIIPLQVISDVIPEYMGIEGEGGKRFYALDDVLNIKAKA